MTHLLDMRAWIQRAFGDSLPSLVEKVFSQHADTLAIAERASTLETSGFHKDPADQLITATALVHKLRVASDDSRIRQWGGVPMLWKTSRG